MSLSSTKRVPVPRREAVRRPVSSPAAKAGLRLGWVLLVVTMTSGFGGCATAVGLVAGPITGPVTTYRHTYGLPSWALPLVVPIAIVIGPFVGFAQGVRCDAGWLWNGAYGVGDNPPFDRVFDPAATGFSLPPTRKPD